MKLNSMQIKQTLNQLDAQVLPDNHPAVPQLSDMFGEHTFFLDAKGLNVLRAVEPPEPPEMETQTGEVINLADWTDTTLTKLSAHEPEPTGIVITLRPIQN